MNSDDVAAKLRQMASFIEYVEDTAYAILFFRFFSERGVGRGRKINIYIFSHLRPNNSKKNIIIFLFFFFL